MAQLEAESHVEAQQHVCKGTSMQAQVGQSLHTFWIKHGMCMMYALAGCLALSEFTAADTNSPHMLLH